MKSNISLCLGIIFFVGLFQTGFCGSFLHGVASGDFTPNAVIIWTRYTPSSGQEDLIDIHWRVSLSNDLTDLSSLVRWGVYTTSSARDYTVKVDVGHLSPNTQYYYGFSDDAVFSPVGKTRTAPSTSADIEQLNFIFVSCQAWRHGYYHAYSLASQADNIDFWIHLGDVIYEEGDYANPGTAQGVREGQLPSVEVVTLDEYRQRHAFYRLESPFQQMAARAPLIAIWDDHEMADNSYGTGADNHEPVCVDAEGRRPGDPGFTPVKCDKDEGSWSTRKLAAEQAYREWMPIRETKSSQSNPFDITRTFEWGNLATIFATDHRVQDDGHRTCVFNCGSDLSNSAFAFVASQIDDPAQIPNNPTLTQLAAQFMSVSEQTNQSAINDNQINALINAFKSSKSAGKPWQFFLSTVIFSNIPYPNFLDTAQLYPSPLKEGLIQYFDTIYANPQTYGYLFRVAYAGSVYDIPFDFQTWDAFPVQRQRLLEIFKEHTNNLVVLAGDSHSAYAHDLRLGDPNTGELVGVEFSGPSLTSFGVETVSPPYWDTFGTVGFDYLNTVWINEHTKYANVIDRGFVFTRVSKTSVISEYHYIRPDVTAVYPYGSFALANATWDGNYYCQQVATEVDSHTLSPTGAPCGATFGHGLDDLDTSISAPFYSSSSSFSVCVLILLSLIILAFAF